MLRLLLLLLLLPALLLLLLPALLSLRALLLLLLLLLLRPPHPLPCQYATQSYGTSSPRISRRQHATGFASLVGSSCSFADPRCAGSRRSRASQGIGAGGNKGACTF